jgi:glycosyltransferase involved in cell wall biosynthesis
MKTLSVVLATFNEERNIARCLDSLKEIADEIIIVDGSSKDKTVEIAKEYGAIVKVTTNKPNFHINKQMAIDMASKDWILQMDADELVGDELRKEIAEILEKGSDTDGFWMPRKNWFLGRFLMKGGQYPDYTLRFYKRGKGRLPQKDVHEQTEVDGEVGYLKYPLLHYPYRDFKDYVRKWNNYNKFFAMQIKEMEKERNFMLRFGDFFSYLIFKPIWWFLLTFLRHKGFVDSWQGFVFSLFSGLRFPVSYIKSFNL